MRAISGSRSRRGMIALLPFGRRRRKQVRVVGAGFSDYAGTVFLAKPGESRRDRALFAVR
jgi:hypothetical protein